MRFVFELDRETAAVHELTAGIDGWLSVPEGVALSASLRAAAGSPEHPEVFGEVWTYDRFRQNIAAAGVSELVVPVVSTSEEAGLAFDHPAGLVFIDGAHDYASARRDWELWAEHVVDGGVVAFHDTPGTTTPRRAAPCATRSSTRAASPASASRTRSRTPRRWAAPGRVSAPPTRRYSC